MSFPSKVLLHSHDSSNMALLVTANSCSPVPDGTSNLLKIRKPICCTPTDLCCCPVWIYSKSNFSPRRKACCRYEWPRRREKRCTKQFVCVFVCVCALGHSQRASSLQIYLRSRLRGHTTSPWAILRPSFPLSFSGPVVGSSHCGNVRHTHQAS